MSELALRVRTAIILGAFFITLFILPSYFPKTEIFLKIAVMFSFVVAIGEYFVFSKSESKKYEITIISFLFIFEVLKIILKININLISVYFVILLATTFYKSRYDINQVKVVFANLAIPTIYLGLCSSKIIPFLNNNNFKSTLLHLILVVVVTDTMAYFFGKKFGKNKLIPAISPGKTIEGTFGGIISGFLVGIFFFNPFIAFILPITAQLSDFIESYLKRINDVKDSSNLLPGHGGVLDRIDGYILCLLFLY